MNYILDACALLALARDEPGADRVQGIIENPSAFVFMHALNLCEVFYDLHRSVGADAAYSYVAGLEAMSILVSEELDTQLWQQAGVLKSEIKRLSLADCFAVAYAGRSDATLLTSDHKEFDPLVDKGICPIEFIR